MDIRSNPVVIPDSFVPYGPSSFSLPTFYAEDLESVLIPEGMIRDRVKGIAQEIFAAYASGSDEPLVLVCVLKSAFKFYCALQQELENLNVESRTCSESSFCPAEDTKSNGEMVLENGKKTKWSEPGHARTLPLMCEFIRVKSYVNTSTATGSKIQIQGVINLSETINNKNILIVEDIIDSGRTIEALLESLKEYKTKSVRVASMLWKRVLHGNAISSFRPHFYGFEIPDRFVIGFGMDYNEKFRDLNHLCIINEKGIKKYAVKSE